MSTDVGITNLQKNIMFSQTGMLTTPNLFCLVFWLH